MLRWLRDWMGGHLFPPREWWFTPYTVIVGGREVPAVWRSHFLAHFGHGLFFGAVWWWVLCHRMGGPWDAAGFAGMIFDGLLWEAYQREYWRKHGGGMALYSNVYDFLLAAAGSWVAAWLLRGL